MLPDRYTGGSPLSRSDSQSFASAQSAPFQNIATTYGRHSFSEAVGFCTFAFIRIISKAHGISPEIGVEVEVIYYNTSRAESQQPVLCTAPTSLIKPYNRKHAYQQQNYRPAPSSTITDCA